MDMEKFSVITLKRHGTRRNARRIELPAPRPHRAAYTKFNIIASDMATVSVASCVTLAADDSCADVRMLWEPPRRADARESAEAILKGKKITDALLKSRQAASEEAEPVSDIRPARNTGVNWSKSSRHG